MDDHLARVTDLLTGDAHEDALRVALELGIRSVGAEEGSLLVLDESSGDLMFVMTEGDMLSESVLRGQHVPVGEGLTGLAALTGEIQVGAPTHGSVLQPEHHDEKSPSRLIAAPMFAANKLIGVLTAATYRPERQFSDEQTQMFGRIAALAGIVVAERRAKAFENRDSGASPAAAADGTLSEQVAGIVQRLTRGDASRQRALLRLLEQVESLAER